MIIIGERGVLQENGTWALYVWGVDAEGNSHFISCAVPPTRPAAQDSAEGTDTSPTS